MVTRSRYVPARASQSIRPADSAPEPAWREQIRRQLASSTIVASLKSDGFGESHDTFYDLVATGASETVTIECGTIMMSRLAE